MTYLIVLLAGAGIAAQAGINARLRGTLGNSMHAVLVSFVVGTVAALVYCLIEGGSVASLNAVKGAPWWVWTGGLLGAGFVWCTIFAVPKIGVVAMFPLVVAGQMIAAVLLEHFGLLGAPTQPVSAGRISGVALVVLGAVVLAVTRDPQPAG
jgi:transporter family-2 protein